MQIIRKPQIPILVVDDDPSIRQLLHDILKAHEIPFRMAENGKEALQLMDKEEFYVFLVDLEMPVISGRELIPAIKFKNKDAVILVITGVDETSIIIEVMRSGVFDYIIKPFSLPQIERVLQKCLEYKYLIDQEKIVTENAATKLRNQIEWLNYKDHIKIKNTSNVKNLPILKDSLLEGASIGSLITMVYMLKDSAEDLGDGTIKVDKSIFETLFENTETCRHQFEGIYNITQILDVPFFFEKTSCIDLVNSLPKLLERITPYLPERSQRILFPTTGSKSFVNISPDMIGTVIEELIINAMKYSPKETDISILAYSAEGYFVITVKNQVNEGYGIPAQFEKTVLEPFFRLRENDLSLVKVEQFGLGLGLTVVDSIIKKHNGMFFIHEAKDHTGKLPKLCVLAEVYLPIQ